MTISTPQGDKFQESRKRCLMACTAPRPSKTALKQRAAIMIHMNMQLTLRVWTRTTRRTRFVSLFLMRAATVATKAPTAELSTRLVKPARKAPVTERMIARGRRPFKSRRRFS